MRSWLVIPALGVVSAAGAVGLGARAPFDVVATGALGAAVTASVRALIGDSPASLAGAMLAPLLLIAMLFDPSVSHAGIARAALAIAAAAWTVVELSRPSTSPLVAVMPAVVTAVLEPAFVALVAFAGARLMTAPWKRPPWAITGPIAGGVALLLALHSGTAKSGMMHTLGSHWFGPAAPSSTSSLATALAERLGPFTSVAAIVGLASLARPRHAELALASCALGAVLVSMRAGVVGPALVGVAAISAALAVARFAALIRIAPGQACTGATASLLLLLPPAWAAIEHGVLRGA
ncbi:MAG: hypothetical protein SFX73_39725 [Kofleriaceae bacterium]|nr:hypothetical protein [Kofleriaceae bacterium]